MFILYCPYSLWPSVMCWIVSPKKDTLKFSLYFILDSFYCYFKVHKFSLILSYIVSNLFVNFPPTPVHFLVSGIVVFVFQHSIWAFFVSFISLFNMFNFSSIWRYGIQDNWMSWNIILSSKSYFRNNFLWLLFLLIMGHIFIFLCIPGIVWLKCKQWNFYIFKC